MSPDHVGRGQGQDGQVGSRLVPGGSCRGGRKLAKLSAGQSGQQ